MDPAFLGSCISLGRRAAVLQIARKDDTPVNFYFGGRLARKLKEAVCKGTVWGLRHEARKPGSALLSRAAGTVEQQSAPQVVTNP